MQDLSRLTKDGEDAWLRLKRSVECCDHFALFFIFSAHPEVLDVFRERLANIYKARVTRLQMPVVKEPEQLLIHTLPYLLHPPSHVKALKAPYWLDLTYKSNKDWKTARINFLLRLNERRETLRHALTNPLILVLPADEFVDIRDMVPDLWSIRQFSLTTDDWIIREVEQQANSLHEIITHTEFAYSKYEKTILHEWERLQGSDSTDRGILLAGLRAYKVFSAHKKNAKALEIADFLVQFSRAQIGRVGETPESLRDLSVSLDNVGGTARALGRLDEAQGCYQESLAIRTILQDI